MRTSFNSINGISLSSSAQCSGCVVDGLGTIWLLYEFLSKWLWLCWSKSVRCVSVCTLRAPQNAYSTGWWAEQMDVQNLTGY